MLVSNIAAVALAAMMSTPALACKCFVNGRPNSARTRTCCRRYDGVFRGGNDCLASSISEDLRGFRSCCGGRSDCDFPRIAEDEEEESGANVTTVVVRT